ncbi:MAG: class I SAM-dependent methyltransferase [Candidatus Eisenbacteria bacterium]|uniref:Class I SAM-dependent methyltransferase n=1 Tax=Eiseniibacteriota bacterium TaxID=2212470 RepID=A0A849SJF3_UNCEI|nr:class I SAM-dependent methyltransferase [Candidatus Eisenbacteria bacterium]
MSARPKLYDRAYFDRWYRRDRQGVGQRAFVRRKVRLALGIAEYLMQREVRSVLDVGAGEGAWRAHLLAERPRLRYTGVDASAYAIRRYGLTRNLHQARFGELAGLELRGPFDLVVCSDVLHYVPERELTAGLAAMGRWAGAVAWIEFFVSGDEFEGDRRELALRSARFYELRLARAGFTHCGLHAYATSPLADGLVTFERGREMSSR